MDTIRIELEPGKYKSSRPHYWLISLLVVALLLFMGLWYGRRYLVKRLIAARYDYSAAINTIKLPDNFGSAQQQQAEWTDTYEIDSGIIDKLYVKKDFNAVKDHLSSILSSPQNEITSQRLSRAYSLLSSIEKDENYDSINSRLAVLDEWCLASPDSHIPLLVRGYFNVAYGWHYRGGGRAKGIPSEDVQKFREKLELAKADLEKSLALNPGDPNSAAALIEVAMGLNMPKNMMESYFQKGAAAQPWHYNLHYARFKYLMPKWHGSAKEMFDEAQACLDMAVEYPALGFVMVDAFTEAWYDRRRLNENNKNVEVSDTEWAIIENVYANYFKRYPDNVYTYYNFIYRAYTVRKYDKALEQFDLVGDNILTEVNMAQTRWGTVEEYNKARAYCNALKGGDLMKLEKRYEDSIPYFEKAIQYDSKSVTAHYGLALACWNLAAKNRDTSLILKAEASLLKAHEIEPGNAEVNKQLNALQQKLKEFPVR
ncbi:MAG: hypothetical protein A2219_05705 [Elusimicrobia bacterium RIFOXYA2_FULL_50_26]|nr:MAG: hypothetical protein A2219_05705 [Elusimicrobia bacterium RIFOXYA2_FULL_50_26]OGS22883.1 MAG: hypothetical protein A2314_02440 [Elusimicrobia bacterium RIFOXYB2_FULL_50_12]